MRQSIDNKPPRLPDWAGYLGLILMGMAFGFLLGGAI
jgi:hypothetical protein